MKLLLKIPYHELQYVLRHIMPMKVDLGSDEEGEKWVRLSKPRELEFLQDNMLSLTLTADFHWPVPMLPDEYHIKKVDAVLKPCIERTAGGACFVTTLKLESLDVSLLPEFLDTLIVKQINKALDNNSARLAWHYSQELGLTVALPEWMEDASKLDIQAREGDVRVLPEQLELALDLQFIVDPRQLTGYAPSQLPAGQGTPVVSPLTAPAAAVAPAGAAAPAAAVSAPAPAPRYLPPAPRAPAVQPLELNGQWPPTTAKVL
jgi:hypothetical protein